MKVDGTLNGELRRSAEQAEVLERAGFDAAFAAEINHDPFLPLAMAATATHRLELGTSVAVAFARTPMTLAYLAHDMQRISEGRFILGLGTQVKAHIVRRFGMPWSRPTARIAEMIQAIRAIWRAWDYGDPLEFIGDFYEHTLMTETFSPGPNPYGAPRIFLAAVGPGMTETAGRVADGLITHAFSTQLYFRTVTLPAVERGLAMAGSSRERFEVNMPGFVVTGDTEESMRATEQQVRRQIAFYGSTLAYRSVLDLHGWGGLADELHRLSIGTRADRWDVMAGLIDDAVLAEFAVVAQPDRLAATISTRYGSTIDRVRLDTTCLSESTLATLTRELQRAS